MVKSAQIQGGPAKISARACARGGGGAKKNPMSDTSGAQSWLERFIAEHGGCAGSVHYRSGDNLLLAATVNIPEVVRKVTATVPRGKGMAGIALAEDRAVTTCNIKTDQSG